MNAYCDRCGDSTGHNNGATQFLRKYQESTITWIISEGLLWDMEEREDVLVLAVVTLRHKIRRHLNEVSAAEQSEFYQRLIIYIKCAASNGMKQLFIQLSVVIADLLLRLKLNGMLMEVIMTSLFEEAPTALCQLLKVLPLEAMHLGEKQQLEDESKELMQCLIWLQNRTDLDVTCLNRFCFLICASWSRAHLLSLEQLMSHKVIENAFLLMINPTLFEGELCMEASECLVALLEHVLHEKKYQSIDLNLESRIFKFCCSIQFPISESESNLMKATAQLHIQMAETYACLHTVLPPGALLEQGPFCFELLLHVANHCDPDTIISSMPMWHKLFAQIPFRFEQKRCTLYYSIVARALDVFFKQCRLPNERLILGSQACDTMTELRNHVQDLLPHIGDLEEIITLKSLTDQLIYTAFGNQSHWMDIEASLFFLKPLIPKLLQQHRQLIIQLIENLPNYIIDPKIHPAVCQQIILLNTECHKCFDNQFLRHKFVSQLIGFRSHLGISPNDRDILEVIIKSCNTLQGCRPSDLISYEEEFRSLAESLSNMPKEPTN
ncbi:uncharacterized protein LOC117793988 [Drosophila innubila]|uniref:uncharacterized protein LOC117793988 n=1 Tax=Drosophila innubila TaxID=198719 RepID=UPI00148D9F38|nr:uncharacterized protein LOC117793988 [Drosophila innubila]